MVEVPYWFERLPDGLIESKARPLAPGEIDGLWDIFAAINKTWQLSQTRDKDHPVMDASNLRSTWLEFVRLRAGPPGESGVGTGTYVGEYENALAVLAELRTAGLDDALDAEAMDRSGLDPKAIPGRHRALLFAGREPPITKLGHLAPDTRLGHAKKYVVDEFMTVMTIASGFKEFGGRNYDGFLGGSRFNRATFISRPVKFPSEGAGR